MNPLTCKPRQSPAFACSNIDTGPALLSTIQPERALQHGFLVKATAKQLFCKLECVSNLGKFEVVY